MNERAQVLADVLVDQLRAEFGVCFHSEEETKAIRIVNRLLDALKEYETGPMEHGVKWNPDGTY